MTCLAANNASARLATSVTVEDLAIQLSTGEGAMFPTPTAGDYFMITVFEQTGDAFNMEIMKCTHRDGDVLTVERAQEGTSAVAFSVSGRVENRFTAGMYTAMGDEIRQIAMDVQRQLAGKQDTLTFDTTPTAGSSNPVTSDGIRSFVQQEVVYNNRKTITSSETFIVPDGVTRLFVKLCGGGGGGGSLMGSSGTSNFINGGPGGTSSFGSYATATGGGGGSYGGGGGGSGSGVGLDVNLNGSPGVDGYAECGDMPFPYGRGGVYHASDNRRGAGGGAGGYTSGFVNVTPGEAIVVTIAGGGSSRVHAGGSGCCIVEWEA